ncbi:hypothetical protein [Thermogemmatispora tikiterensis]|uniref:Uncharacterized protein n=1 Tax=Thermogemmatispora tikiterensis TaxID=1825093 RepID=A0A328VLP3_9CHLR|nr:hypothetical protein [Thermogemmatispora tikiterensis]RAQ97771.1 hypothetical protein A4R35_19685 [Thermogemmatispora tikiterensis]
MIVFRRYRKVAPTRARVLTEQDYQERGGLIQAPEGLLRFSPGDYLARDAKGEWPIWRRTLERRYRQLTPADEEGFALYQRTDTVWAAALPEAFVIDGMQGKAGDYLVISEEGSWPVDREIFEQTYALMGTETELTPPNQEQAALQDDHPSS